MEMYCVSCKKYTANGNLSVPKTNQNCVYSTKLLHKSLFHGTSQNF